MNEKSIYLLLGAGLLLMLTKSPFQSRGFRNNNPFNIKQTDIDWLGEESIGLKDDDPTFEEFILLEYGVRAGAKLLQNYQSRHGLNTLRQIITRFAPPSENDTDSYIASVARRTHWLPDQHLDLFDPVTITLLSDAIIYHENGGQPLSKKFIWDSIQLEA